MPDSLAKFKAVCAKSAPGPWLLHEADERGNNNARLLNLWPGKDCAESIDYLPEPEARMIGLLANCRDEIAGLIETSDRLLRNNMDDAEDRILLSNALLALLAKIDAQGVTE